MKNWVIEFHPVIPKHIFLLATIIPFGIIVISGYLVIQQNNTLQLFMIIAIAFVLPAVIYGLLVAAQKQLHENSVIRIEDGKLFTKRNQEEKTLAFKDIDSIGIHSKYGFASELKIKMYNGDLISFHVGGSIRPQDHKAMSEILKEYQTNLVS